MNLYTKLQQRAADKKPIRIGLIGAGKFGSMYLAQVPRTPGVHLVAEHLENRTADLRNLDDDTITGPPARADELPRSRDFR